MKQKITMAIAAIFFCVQSNAQIPPLAWSKFYNVVHIDDDLGPHEPNDICYSPSGKIYVTGTVYGQDPITFEPFNATNLIRITAAGSLATTVTLPNTDAYTFEYGAKIASDASNNAYLLARDYYSATYDYDILLVKYNGAFTEQWRQYLYGSGATPDIPGDLAVDASNNVIISGQERQSVVALTDQTVIVKYNSAGVFQWSNYYPYAGRSAVTTDANNGVYLASVGYSAVRGQRIRTVKFSPAGAILWERFYDAAATTGNDQPFDIAVNNITGDVYVSGYGDAGAPKNDESILLRYNAAGTLLWAKKFGDTSDDVGVNVGLDIAGNAYIASKLNCSSPDTWGTTANFRKYNPAGTLLYTRSHAYTNINIGQMKVSPAGTLYAATTISYAPWNLASLILKYDNAGVLQWSDLFAPTSTTSSSNFEWGKAVAINSASNEIAVAGQHFCESCAASLNNWSWWVRRFSPTSRLANPGENEFVNNDSPLSIYPNPADDEINIASNQKVISINISDLSGRKIKSMELNQKENENISVSISDLPAGVYLCSVVRETDVITKKIIRE